MKPSSSQASSCAKRLPSLFSPGSMRGRSPPDHPILISHHNLGFQIARGVASGACHLRRLKQLLDTLQVIGAFNSPRARSTSSGMTVWHKHVLFLGCHSPYSDNVMMIGLCSIKPHWQVCIPAARSHGTKAAPHRFPLFPDCLGLPLAMERAG